MVNEERETIAMYDKTIRNLIEYLKNIKGWQDAEIIKLLQYITK